LLPIKMVALDLDGTLLTDDLTIEPEVKEAIKRVQERGILVTLATGRMFRSARPFARELGLKGPLVVYNGAQVREAETGELLFERPLPLAIACPLICCLLEKGYPCNVYVDDDLFVEQVHPVQEEYARRVGVKLHPVENMVEFLHRKRREPVKIVAIRSPEELDCLEKTLRQKMGKKVHFTRSLPFYLEILHPLVNKGEALRILAGRYKIKPQEIIAVGDSYNDLQMIRYAGVGVAMANAPEEVKAAALYITGSNNEGGVAQALEKFILSRKEGEACLPKPVLNW